MWKPTVLFLALAAGLSSIFYVIINVTGTAVTWVFGLMWMPALAAVITCVILGRPLRFLGLSRWSTKYAVIGYLIPVAYCIVLYAVIWLTGIGGFPNLDFLGAWAASTGTAGVPDGLLVVIFVLASATTGMLISVITAMGEEIGWRGFLVPELYRHMSFVGVGLISGLVWSAWHYPITSVIFAASDLPVWYWLITFTVGAVGVSFVGAWLRLKSGSLWPAIMLHAGANLWMQSIVTPITVFGENTKWIAGDLGAGISIVAVIIAIVAVVLRKRLPSSAEFEAVNGIPHSLETIRLDAPAPR